jgi:hypothetical protein
MGKVNIARIILGGLIAGIFIYCAEGVLHMGLLKADWAAWKDIAVKAFPNRPDPNMSMTLWAVWSFVIGIVGVWIYAAIRPRYGAGVGTGLLAGLITWLAVWLPGALDCFAIGVIPHRIIVLNLAGGFVIGMLGILLGAWLYKE